MADPEKKRCGACACCKQVACPTCAGATPPPKKPQTVEEMLKNEVPAHSVKAGTLAGESDADLAKLAKAGAAHARIHGEFAAEAAKAGNVALAHNEAQNSVIGGNVSAHASNELQRRVAADKAKKEEESQCCLRGQCGNPKCPLAATEKLAAEAYKDATGAHQDSTRALATAKRAGPNPGIPGTPSNPSPKGYPGGPKNPFGSPTVTL